ncbi:helix-turn-helix domain-containing protein [Mycolicibacillus trivialis]
MTDPESAVTLDKLGALLESRVEEMSRRVVARVRADVVFYRDNDLVSDDQLLQATTDNLRFVFLALQNRTSFDTTPAADVGRLRARTGVPRPAVMDAFRVASHTAWDQMMTFAADDPEISRAALLSATARLWDAQDRYTQAMTTAYHETATQLAIDDAAERAALTEALLQGRPLGEYSLWDVAELLRLPARGPYVVIAARLPKIGQQALRSAGVMLRSLDVHSAWRLLPDTQIGIAHLPSRESLSRVVDLLGRVTTTDIGVSPIFTDLADTATSLRYARVALEAPEQRDSNVRVFDDSVLGIAAVSAPEVTRKLSEITLGPFNALPSDERLILSETFAVWLDHNGSVSDAAAALFCHPNTVRNRLRRIEEHTGRSLTAPRELAELCLAFEIAKRTAS